MNSIEKLAKIFSSFPGIGPRQSKRFVYYLLTRDKKFLDELIAGVEGLKKEIRTCTSCFRFFQADGGSKTLCEVCESPNRDSSLLMIVEKDVDLENVERSGVYEGLYFVLGGTLPILEKKPQNHIRIEELENLADKRFKEGSLKEVIVATSANPDGENTSDFIKERLALLKKKGLKISVLGRGLSTGTELEYSDKNTLKFAFENRSSK